jgi:ATP-dependent DNA helicase RecQ
VAQVFHSLKIIQRQGYLEFTEEVDSPSRVCFIVNRDDLYRFQVANEHYDAFVKLLLRSYTGLFTGYTIIDEELLALRASTTGDVIYNYLKFLDTAKIIDYIPKKRTPYIYFSRERIAPEKVVFSKENYDLRKKEYVNRMEAVIRYASSTTACRSQMLLAYFGEKESERCGNCDTCQSKNQLGLSRLEFDKLAAQIRKELENPQKAEELLFKTGPEHDQLRSVLRWLMDNELVVKRIDGKLEWRGD